MTLEDRIIALAQAIGADVKALQSAGGAGPSGSGTATLDFGVGSNEASILVSGLSEIAAGAEIAVWVSATDTSASHSASDHRYFPALASLTASGSTEGVGFTIYARSVHKLTGTWAVRFSWKN